jgi:transcriptional regulator of acetoin/glycerol metabolism
MNSVSTKEIERQFRVLQQTLSMHSQLRDSYSWKAIVVEVVLLIASVIFCSATFAADWVYERIGIAAKDGQLIVGVASVLSFAASLALLIVDWRGKASKHEHAAEQWSALLEEFRNSRSATGDWPEEHTRRLSDRYWETSRNSANLPERQFNKLKSKYLKKVEVSKLKSEYPGCPRFVLSMFFHFKDTSDAIRDSISGKDDK